MTSSLAWQYHRRHRLPAGRRDRRTIVGAYSVRSPRDFDINRFASTDNLKIVFNHLEKYGGQAPGSDGITYRELGGTELPGFLNLLREIIQDGSYLPRPLKSVAIEKIDGSGERILSLQCIQDRVISKAFQLCFDSYWSARLPSFGLDVRVFYRRLAKTIRKYGCQVLVIDDIRNCYPNTPASAVVETQFEHFQDARLRQLAQRIILGHEGLQNETAGVGQGSPYIPVAVDSFFHTRLHGQLEAIYGRNDFLHRYVDNLVIAARNLSEGERIRSSIRTTLSVYGLELKCKDKTISVEEQNQETLLGLIPQWRNDKFTFSTPVSAFESLNRDLSEAVVRDTPHHSVLQTVMGWIQFYKIGLESRASRNVAIDRIHSIVDFHGIHISPDWISRSFHE